MEKTIILKFCCVWFLLAALSCGSKDPEQLIVNLTFSGSNPFQDPDLVDIVFIITDVDHPSTTVVFPPECAAEPQLRDGCGFIPATKQFVLDPTPIPKGATMTLTVRLRDTDGNNIAVGDSGSFVNDPKVTPTIDVPITLTP